MAAVVLPMDDAAQRRRRELTFAVGFKAKPISMTWMLTWNTRFYVTEGRPGVTLDMFVWNDSAGADRGKVSFHGENGKGQDYSVHWKVKTEEGVRTSEPGNWPDPLPTSDGRTFRMMTIALPRACLEDDPPPGRSARSRDPVLLPPPDVGKQIDVDLFYEMGHRDPCDWPARVSMGTNLLDKRDVAIVKNGEVAGIIGRWVLVWRVVPQWEMFNDGQFTFPCDRDRAAEFAAAAGRPRTIMYGARPAAGQKVPWMVALPVSVVANQHQVL